MPYFHPAVEDEQWLQKHAIKLPKPKQPLQCSHSILLTLPNSVRCGISVSKPEPILNFISWNLHDGASWTLVKEYLKLSKVWNPCLHFAIMCIGHRKTLLFCGLVIFCCGKYTNNSSIESKSVYERGAAVVCFVVTFSRFQHFLQNQKWFPTELSRGWPRLYSPQL